MRRPVGSRIGSRLDLESNKTCLHRESVHSGAAGGFFSKRFLYENRALFCTNSLSYVIILWECEHLKLCVCCIQGHTDLQNLYSLTQRLFPRHQCCWAVTDTNSLAGCPSLNNSFNFTSKLHQQANHETAQHSQVSSRCSTAENTANCCSDCKWTAALEVGSSFYLRAVNASCFTWKRHRLKMDSSPTI